MKKVNRESLNSSLPKIIELHSEYNNKLKDFITKSISHHNSLTIPKLKTKYTSFTDIVNNTSTTKLKNKKNHTLHYKT